MSSLMALSFHPAFYPPKSGGEERLYNVYNYLSKYHKIKLISFTYFNSKNIIEVVKHNENFEEIRIPKTKISAVLHHLIDKYTNIKECSAVITSIESKFNKNFNEIIKKEIQEVDILIFVYPYLYTVPKNLLGGKKVIYESHNVEYELMAHSLSESLIGKQLLKYVSYLEKSLVKRSDYIFAVSEENKIKLAKLYNFDMDKVYISPNGVNSEKYDSIAEGNTYHNNSNICIFIGSYHPPNIEAIKRITMFASNMPDTQFLIAGSASQYYINSSSDIIERINKPYKTPESQKLCLIDGFYNIEYWDLLPTLWCKSEFKISVTEDVDTLKLKAYSSHKQTLKVKTEDEVISFDLKENWNWIEIKINSSKDQNIYFSCQKRIENNKRDLGIAIQEINYYEENIAFKFDLIQGSNQTFAFKKIKNVILLNQISDAEKLQLYELADIALNPMMSGSGTNIKMLDYMAAGLPIISTPVGARGLNLENYSDAIICNISEFPLQIKKILKDKELYTRISCNGRKLVKEKYDWKKIVDDMEKILEER